MAHTLMPWYRKSWTIVAIIIYSEIVACMFK